MSPDIFSLPESPRQESKQPPADQILAHSLNQAQLIEEAFGASIMAAVAKGDLGGMVQSAGFKKYRDRLLAASGDPQDPIEKMLVEQLAWAHLRLGNLHVKAAVAESAELVEAYSAAAAKLMTEFRKSTLALREFRSPDVPKQLTVVKQQNVGTNQQIALVDGTCPRAAAGEKTDYTEQGSNPGLLTHVEQTIPFTPANRRTAEPVEAKRADAGRPAAAQRRRAAKSSLASVNGTANGRR